MAVWHCRVLLVVVLCHLALSSPAVRRDLRALSHEPPQDPLALAQPERLGEDAFGGAADTRGSREKRLLKTVSVVKGVKAVATKAAVAGAKAIGAKLLKTSAGVAAGAVGLKAVAAKSIGAKLVKPVVVKTVTTVAALGIKALLFKLLFGLTKSSLQSSSQPRQHGPTTTPAPGSEDEIPQFDPNKVSLQVPDELFAPAFSSVNSISTILGNLIQNTAERVARLVERMKPLLRSSLGFKSRKRETEKDNDPDTNDLSDNETTFFTDSDTSADEVQDIAGSETQSKTTATTDEGNLHSPLKSSYTALSENS